MMFMKGILFSLCCSLGMATFLGSAAIPQTASHTIEPPAGQAVTHEALVAELVKSVDARKVKAGSPVEASLTMALISHGVIVIPRGTKLFGRVISATERTKSASDSSVELTFDRIVLRNGREIPLKLVIHALGAPMQALDPDSQPASDLDFAAQTSSRPAPGPNEMKSIAQTTYPGTRGPANSAAGSQEQTNDVNLGQNPRQSLGPMSYGVIGMKDVALSNTDSGSLITSKNKNLHLSGGTQVVLSVFAPRALAEALGKTGK
jgi:hypothetical protein